MDNWESQAEALFGELQTSALLAAVFEAKVHDLAQICENLGDKNNCQAMEIDQLKESAITLRAENEEIKCSVEGLNNQLHITSHEMDNWESHAEALFGELQTSALLAAVFETKVHDLAQICENLGDKNNCQATEIDQLKESAITLRAENEEVKSRLSLYVTALSSVKDSIAGLEKHTISNAPPVEVGDKEEKDELADEEQSSMLPDAPQDFQELQVQIKAIERALVEKEKLLVLENSSANSKLEAALRCIEELKFEINLLQGVGMSKLDTAYSNAKELGRGMQKHTREISAGGTEVITKDIILDQISECSSHGISRRETLEANDPMLEMWEMANHDGSIDSNVRRTHKETKAPSDKKHERGHLSMESFSEKEFAIDKLEISKNFSGSYREGNEKKILERLDSDAQKLTNLDTIVQDLKMKVQVAEKSKRGKGIEYGSVKEQLEESEEAISKLLIVTQKLKKAVEDEFPFLDEKSALASDEAGVAKKRKIAQQARRGSEKIGRLQMEVQKLQFLLAKLDESRSKGKIKAAGTRVLLQDYIYGRTSSKPRRKKGHFCSCVRPQTKED